MRSQLIRLAFVSVALLMPTLGCSGGDPSAPEPGEQTANRGPLGKADGAGSCVDHCGGKSAGSCYCDTECAKYGDCCEDIGSACGLESGPTIHFDEDFSESVSGELTRGATVEIAYDADRLTQCRGTQNGYPQWAITGYYRIDGGEVKSFAAAGNMAPTPPALPSITLDHRGELEMWFQNTNRWGCNAYDSNFGDNYRFEVK